jgi:hypothetical protein
MLGGERPVLLRSVDGASRAYRTLSQQFLYDLHQHWREHGQAALDATAERSPHIYMQIVAKLAQVHQVEVGGPGDFATAMNREQLLDRVGERFGTAGRKMFEQFVQKLERLATEAKGAGE